MFCFFFTSNSTAAISFLMRSSVLLPSGLVGVLVESGSGSGSGFDVPPSPTKLFANSAWRFSASSILLLMSARVLFALSKAFFASPSASSPNALNVLATRPSLLYPCKVFCCRISQYLAEASAAASSASACCWYSSISLDL